MILNTIAQGAHLAICTEWVLDSVIVVHLPEFLEMYMSSVAHVLSHFKPHHWAEVFCVCIFTFKQKNKNFQVATMYASFPKHIGLCLDECRVWHYTSKCNVLCLVAAELFSIYWSSSMGPFLLACWYDKQTCARSRAYTAAGRINVFWSSVKTREMLEQVLERLGGWKIMHLFILHSCGKKFLEQVYM